jgi:hypothetical protein
MPWTEITREQVRREGLRYLRPGDGPFGAFWLKRDGLLASRRAFRRRALRAFCLPWAKELLYVKKFPLAGSFKPPQPRVPPPAGTRAA